MSTRPRPQAVNDYNENDSGTDSDMNEHSNKGASNEMAGPRNDTDDRSGALKGEYWGGASPKSSLHPPTRKADPPDSALYCGSGSIEAVMEPAQRAISESFP